MTFKAINALYPGVFKPRECKVQNFWSHQSIDTAREATRWLVEEKLGLTPAAINSKVRQEDFINSGLLLMLREFYGDSYFNALDDVYPSQETE